MLPTFPKFKKLEYTDRDDIEAITANYEPYSDFNFSSVWSWDIENTVEISVLNGNLVLHSSDHLSNEPTLSFLGNNLVSETLQELFAFLPSANVGNKLRSVPGISLQGADVQRYALEIDQNSCDYVYDLPMLASYTDSKYSHKRKAANNFSRTFPDVTVRMFNANKGENLRAMQQLNQRWIEHKHELQPISKSNKEFDAIERFITAQFTDSLCVGIYKNEELLGYSLFSLLNESFALCHFSKADVEHYGIYEYLMRESAAILVSKGYTKLNYEEDLGMEGLRQAKLSYKPASFLEKYSVREIH